MEPNSWIPVGVAAVSAAFTIYYNTITNRRANRQEITVAIAEVRKHADESMAKTEAHIEMLSGQMAELNASVKEIYAKNEMIWDCLKNNISVLLKSYPTKLRKDKLLTKMEENTLTLKQAETLKEILINEQAIKDVGSCLASGFAIGLLNQKIYDLKKENKDED